MLSFSRIAAPAVVGLGLVTACAGTTESTAPSSVDVKAYTSVQCDYLVRCQPFALDNVFGTKDACATQLAAAITPELTLKGVALSQAEAQACASKYAAQSCDATSAPAECTFKGTLADDAPCATSLQCASGNCSFASNADGTAAACGTCRPFVAEGGDCTKDTCAEGLGCNTASKCIKGAAEGGPCTDAFDCGGSLQCVGGKCAALFAEGAPCKPREPSAGVCNQNQNLFCKPTVPDASAGTCAKYAFANVGEACGLDATSFVATLCTASQCSTTTTSAVGKCVATLAEGAACSKTTVGCSFGLQCTGGVCKRTDLAACNP